MDNRICRCKFENEGRFFALISPDGRLKVWDCTNGKLKHDIAPDSHLGGSSLTCISWRTSSKLRSKRRKRKSLDASLLEKTCEIGLGNAIGGVFIFDVLNGEIKHHLRDGHDNKVNDMKWNRTTDLLYSCSDDRYITEWTVDTTAEIKCKWKGDKTSVHSIQVSPKGDCLLSAGRDIRLWDLETKEILQKFTGHGTSISQLLFTPFKSEGMSNGCKTNGYYFLSGAEQDRFLNAWKVDVEVKDKSSIVSYSVSDEPVSLALSHHPDKEKPLHLIVVSRDGQLHLFEQSLNGHVKKPVKPKSTVQLATPERKDTSPEPVSIISAHFVESSEPSILIAYGSAVKPQFETLKYESLEQDVCLVRDYRPGLLLREENNNQQTLNTNKAVVKNDLLTTLSMENMALARPSCGESGSSTQFPRKSATKMQELSMEDRLKSMNLTPSSSEKPKMERHSIPKAGSLTQMLIQALNSQDKKLLEDVFSVSSKPRIIQSTIRRLPVNYVIPFMTELVHRIQASPSRGSHLVSWIKTILTIHMSYLMSVPNLVESLGGLYQLFESRVGVYSRLCKLQGRLDLMLAQVSAQSEVVEDDQLLEPMMVYKEDDSSEVSDLEELENNTSEDSAESMKDDASDDDRETPSDEEKAVSSEDEDSESKEHCELSDGDVEMKE